MPYIFHRDAFLVISSDGVHLLQHLLRYVGLIPKVDEEWLRVPSAEVCAGGELAQRDDGLRGRARSQSGLASTSIPSKYSIYEALFTLIT